MIIPATKERHINFESEIEKIFLLLILLIGSVLRILAAYKLSLSNDELSALTRARHDTFSEMITKGVFIDFHPAGIQSFIYYWIKLFGDHPFVYRLPFVICGTLSIFLIFKIGKRMFGSFTGLFAASVFSVFQFTVLYSIFSRPYSPGLLFALIATNSWMHLFFPDNKNKERPYSFYHWIGFTLSMIGCIHTHYFSLVFAAGLGVTGLFFLRSVYVKHYIISGILIVLSFLPELKIFEIQISTGDIGGWLASPGSRYIPEFLNHVFNESSVFTTLILALVFIGFCILLIRKNWTRFHTISSVFFLFSFLTAYLYSVFRHPVIQFSTLYFTIPFLLFLFGSSIEQLFFRFNWSFWFIPVLLFYGLFHTVFVKGMFHRSSYGVFKDVAKDIGLWQLKYGKENVPVILNVINPEYMNYYFRELDVEPLIWKWKVESRGDIESLENDIANLNSDYLCFAWSNADHPYEIIRMVREKFPKLIEKKAYFNSATYLFSKTGENIANEPFLEVKYDFSKGTWTDSKTPITSYKDVIQLDSLNIYGPSFQFPIRKIPSDDFWIVTSHIAFRSVETVLNATLVISFDSSGVPKEYYSLDLDECNIVPGEWQETYFSRLITGETDKEFDLNTYVYNGSHRNIELKKMLVTIEKWDNPYKLSD